MRNYRLVLLLKSELSKEKKKTLLDDVQKWAGEVEKGEIKELGEKKLAYPINREKKGDYVLYSFTSEKVADDLEKKVQLQESVLRHLLIRD